MKKVYSDDAGWIETLFYTWSDLVPDQRIGDRRYWRRTV